MLVYWLTIVITLLLTSMYFGIEYYVHRQDLGSLKSCPVIWAVSIGCAIAIIAVNIMGPSMDPRFLFLTFTVPALAVLGAVATGDL